MAIKVIVFLCLSATAIAQNFAVLTHGAANSIAFRNGCPSNWPSSYRAIGNATNLPFGLHSPPWIIETEEQLNQRMTSLSGAIELWNKAQEDAPRLAAEQAKAAEAAAKAAKKAEADALISEVEIGFKEWQSADEKAKGEVLLKLLHLILDALRSLGADVKQVEKPTSEIVAPK